jgi:hypothetical protein
MVLDHLPRLCPILRKPAAGEYEGDVADELSRINRRSASEHVSSANLEDVKRNEHWWRRKHTAFIVADEVKAADELLVKDGDFTV